MSLTNLSDGAAAATLEYDPFGNVIQAIGAAANACPFGFSTKYTDTETGLLYYGYRYNQPTTGRWLSRDLIEEQGGVSIYGFVGNSPIKRIDDLGLEFIDAGLSLVPLANLPSNGSGWFGSTSLSGRSGFLSDSLIESGEDRIEEFSNGASGSTTSKGCGCYCARVLQAKTFKVRVKSWVANDQVGKAYTAAGLNAITGHEDRRRQVYRIAYDAYIAEIDGAWKSVCNPVCSSKPGEAKKKLQKWLEALRSKAQAAFFNYSSIQQARISDEGDQANVLRDSANLINGLATIQTPGAATTFKLPSCPACEK